MRTREVAESGEIMEKIENNYLLHKHTYVLGLR